VSDVPATPWLTDGVVVLREFVAGDATALAEIWADATIRARNSVPEPTTDAAEQWVHEVRRRNAARETWEWAIVDADSGALAGRRALKDICWNKRRASAACWVAPQHRGRRFAGRSLRLAAAHAFAQGLIRVHAEIETDNHASIRSVLAAGMRHEGTLRAWYIAENGDPLDLHVFGLLNEDLRSAHLSGSQ
jgi:RimJ/RimL family protein N-acetyltransferase